MIQAAALRARLVAIPYRTDCWVTSCTRARVSKGCTRAIDVTLIRHGSARTIECDYLGCGFHLVPNVELGSLHRASWKLKRALDRWPGLSWLNRLVKGSESRTVTATGYLVIALDENRQAQLTHVVNRR